MHMDIFPAYRSLHVMHARHHQRPKEGIWSPEMNGIIDVSCYVSAAT